MSKKRLLVIEDDVDVAEMLVVYFSGQGYDMINAMSGEEGIAMARAKFPNLILLDIMLPDMDGFDICRSLRTTALTKFIPIIFLTQRDGRGDKVAGLELGADDYITKPFDVEELRLRVQGSLQRASREALHEPRTGLPTASLISDTRDVLSRRPNFTELDIQLAGFKAFRDLYGFVAADEALAYIARVFAETVAGDGTPEDFAGIYDENRFVIFTFSPDINKFIEALCKRFSEGAKTFYNFIDSERGFVIVDEASQQHAPLMYLTVSRAAEGVMPR
ncbi:MAG: response regulator [Anaerolineae bacterium]|nr:response regulator [Anaerolineae bacterium]